jgi:DNA-directed RNA polymerase subunit RPC12/RpoP
MATKVASEPKSKSKATRSPASRSKNAAASKKSAPKKPVAKKWESRAVTRLIEAGSMTECEHCGERVKFRARQRDMQVICNVYTKGVWTRVEHYHEDCYVKADEPFGPAED